MIVTTDAVVLQTRRFGETSKIVTLYTRLYGKMGVVARGVMTPRSKTASVLQPMAQISVVIYRKEGRELQNLSSAEEHGRYRRVTSDLDRISAGLAIVELVNATMHDEDRNDALFDDLCSALTELDAEDAVARNVLLWFMVHLADRLGFTISTRGCAVCNEGVSIGQTVAFSMAHGGVLCDDHRDSAGFEAMHRDAYALLQRLCEGTAAEARAVPSDDRTRAALVEMLTSFIRYHVDGMRRLKVSSVALKLLGEIARA